MVRKNVCRGNVDDICRLGFGVRVREKVSREKVTRSLRYHAETPQVKLLLLSNCSQPHLHEAREADRSGEHRGQRHAQLWAPRRKSQSHPASGGISRGPCTQRCKNNRREQVDSKRAKRGGVWSSCPDRCGVSRRGV